MKIMIFPNESVLIKRNYNKNEIICVSEPDLYGDIHNIHEIISTIFSTDEINMMVTEYDLAFYRPDGMLEIDTAIHKCYILMGDLNAFDNF